MKKIILIILVSIFLATSGVFANNNLVKVECNNSFNNECGKCFELEVPDSGIINNLNFYHFSEKREILYKEEQEPVLLLDKNGRNIRNFKSSKNYIYPPLFSNLYNEDEEGYVLEKKSTINIFKQISYLNINSLLGYNTDNLNILGYLKVNILTHNFAENGEITPDAIERTQCIKILKKIDKNLLKLQKKLDIKINNFINKIKFKSKEEKIDIYNKFIGKLNKILERKKYIKYFKILNYIKFRIKSELKKEINNY